MHAQDDDANVRIALHHLGACFDSVEFRHRNVDDHNVRFELFSEAACFASIAGLACHLKVRLPFKNEAKALSDDSVVIGDQNANLAHAPAPTGGTGIVTRSSAPFCGWGGKKGGPRG